MNTENLKDKAYDAISGNNTAEFKKLVKEAKEKGVEEDVVNSDTLNFSIFLNRTEIVNLHITYNNDVNSIDSRGNTPLTIAILYNRPEIAKLLVCNGANVDNGYLLQRLSKLEKMCENLVANCNIKEMQETLNGFAKDNKICDTYNRVIPDPVPAGLSSFQNSYEDSYPTVTSSATKASFFINNLVNWIVHSSANAIVGAFHSITDSPFPSTQQQNVNYHSSTRTDSNQNFSQANVSGGIQLIDLTIRNYTGEKYSGLSNELPLTKEQILESKINSVKRSLELGVSIFEKMNQCPQSSLNDTQISKVKTCEKSL